MVALVWPYAHAFLNFKRAGFFDQPTMRKYQGSNVDNLKAIWTAMKLFHQSEEQFPNSEKWMDDIKLRLRTNDLSEADTLKKLVNPLLQPPSNNVFGYAMNDSASKKYKGDIKDPKTILVFNSSDTKWNAHGDPEKLKTTDPTKGNKGITIDGTVVDLK